MKEYFYIEGNNQKGPFTQEEIKSKGLSNETLVWFDDIDNWTPLINVPELNNKLKKTPPPLPIDNESIKNKLADKITSQPKEYANNNLPTNIFRPSKKELTWVISWCSFHFLALILSNVLLFNYQPKIHFIGEPKSKESLWPFVKFVERKYDQLPGGQSWEYYQEMWAQKKFNGLFYQYDWTEFVLYFGAGLIVYLIIKVFKNM